LLLIYQLPYAPAHIPFGTTIQIDNDFYTVTDRGGAIIVDRLGFYHIDVWLPSKEEVEKFGRKIKSIKIWRK
jgi:3D (Asp-Asp-Asp) domain-containing protein